MQMNMTLYDLTRKYGEGKGESTMWSTLSLVSNAVDSLPLDEKNALIRKVYGVMSGKHYNEEFAREDISKMYYTDGEGKHYAPYWTDEDLRALYEQYGGEIPGYNFWDWAVTMNMIKSDHCSLLSDWFPEDDEAERNNRIVRLAINWLQDEDNPFGQSKVWCYFNSRL